MDGLGGQIVIGKVTHKGTEHLGCPVHCYSSRTLMSLTTSGSQKPIATVLRKMSIHGITPPVLTHDDATQPLLGLAGSSPPLAAGPAVAPDTPWSDPGTW